MNPKKRNTSRGVITFHTPLPVSLLKSEESMVDMKDATGHRESPSQPSTRTRSTSKCVKRDEDSLSRPQLGAKQNWLSHPSLRRLQANMEAENQQVKDIIQPLLDTENGLVKELESFLSRRAVTELRRKELLHKRWTERVWFPLQRRVEEHVSSCSPAAAKRRQSLYSDYLHHCNTKGFVSLDHYDLREYNPFLLHIKKLSPDDLKDPLYRRLHERLRRTDHSSEAGCKYTRRQVEKLPQSDRLLSEPVMSQTDTLLQASSNRPVFASRKTPAEDETEGRRSSRCVSSRLDIIPYHVSATASLNGRCHRNGCWLSRCGRRTQPASSHQLQSSTTSK